MSICCPKSIKACALRITRLNGSDIPLDPLTPNSRIQTAGFMELGLSPDMESGSVLEIANQCGDVCITDHECNTLKGFELDLKLCGVPLAVLEMLTGVTLLDDGAGNFVGAAVREGKSENCVDNVMIEFWSKNADRGTCAIDGTPKNLWIHWVLPRTINWEISGGLTFTNGPLEFSLSGYAENNPNWYPSLPGPTFASYVPGAGDPDGLPSGAAPTVLPPAVAADVWTLADVAVIQGAGPLAWKCVDVLPSPIDDCGYLSTGGCAPTSITEDFCGEEFSSPPAPWVVWPDSHSGSGMGNLTLSGACSVDPKPLNCS